MVDPAVPTQPAPNVPNPGTEPVKITVSKKKLYIALGAIGGVCLLILLYFLLPQNIKTQLGIAGMNSSPSSLNKSTNGKKPENAIAKVGEEYIFQKDLDAELANFPGGEKDAGVKKRLMDKLVKDSIVLQAAQKEKLAVSTTNQSKSDPSQTNEANTPISLDESIYNAEDKNYMKRIAAVKNVEKAVNNNIDHISGTMVSVWFQNQIPTKMSLSNAKQEALKRITALHDRVIKKEITIEEAGKLISTDPSYAQLDPGGYQNNAIIYFSNPKGKQITIDSGFDDILWKTKQGEITPVYLGKSINEANTNPVEAYYIFGEVKKKIDTGNTQDFAQWYEGVKNTYDVTYY